MKLWVSYVANADAVALADDTAASAAYLIAIGVPAKPIGFCGVNRCSIQLSYERIYVI